MVTHIGAGSNGSDQGRRAPYAPPATVMDVVSHYRERDVPPQLDKTRLLQIGVSEGLINRTWSTLDFLGLILGDGTTTEHFRNLRYASDEDYPGVFRALLNEAYAEIFTILDPETADEFALDRAFRPYSPGGQRSRMITLFLGLCRQAGYNCQVQERERTSQVTGSVRRRAARQETPKPPRKRPDSDGVDGDDADDETGGGEQPGQGTALPGVRQEYADYLFKKIQEDSDGDSTADLMDRLERILGVRD